MITERMMRAAWVAESAVPQWINLLNAACEEFHITTRVREIPFLANAAHETQGFSRFAENLNYSSDRLLEIFPFTPQRTWGFTPNDAPRYARNPERIANRVYANRMGNGSEASGDGWRYRGRGVFQLTGLANYAEFGNAFGRDLVADPDAALDPSLSCRIAGRFWQTRGCNALADDANIAGIRRVINGGYNGLKEVVDLIVNIRAAE